MANALIGGLRKQGYSAAGIQVVEPVADLREKLTETYGVRCAASRSARVSMPGDPSRCVHAANSGVGPVQRHSSTVPTG